MAGGFVKNLDDQFPQTGLLAILLKVVDNCSPKMVNIAITTRAINKMINAYSTIPWPRSFL
jgi:hypothetical protein